MPLGAHPWLLKRRIARPPIAAGAWYEHLGGRLPVLGARFGGLKSVPFRLLGARPLVSGRFLSRCVSLPVKQVLRPSSNLQASTWK
jgi:hypothetical protein